ncbi:MAG: aspartate--ammonia ligase [Oscillospiraceae bacterium]|nr:aspartate--ammonia ligase [Oscillospiraceae bacterium]
MNPIIPQGYAPLLSLYDTQCAIGRLKDTLIDNLVQRLDLTRVSAPLMVDAASTIADRYAMERPITFPVPAINATAEIVQSLDKWKRVSLYRYGFPVGKGLYADMNAIRWQQTPDNINSVYVDHWAWAKRINEESRNLDTLCWAVKTTVMALCDAEITMRNMFPELLEIPELERNITFTTAQELEELYPDLTPTERENAFARVHHTAFVRNIGTPLKSGKPHSLRRPDTGAWPLSGRLIFWDSVLQIALPVASIGIHVDAAALDNQLELLGGEQPASRYHDAIRDGTLPAAIGGSLGQSRLVMLILGKAHIGEVQQGIWDQETRDACEAAGIPLL